MCNVCVLLLLIQPYLHANCIIVNLILCTCTCHLTSLNCDIPVKVAPVATLCLLVPIAESADEEPPFFPLPLPAISTPPTTDRRSIPGIKNSVYYVILPIPNLIVTIPLPIAACSDKPNPSNVAVPDSLCGIAKVNHTQQ